jgi:hypothetical protein
VKKQTDKEPAPTATSRSSSNRNAPTPVRLEDREVMSKPLDVKELRRKGLTRYVKSVHEKVLLFKSAFQMVYSFR